jgi:UDP-arabinose 4-epimerase
LPQSSAFVVGGAGYIGSHTAKALARGGIAPIVYDNLSTGHADVVKWGQLIEGDILDADRLTAALKANKPDLVIHFAASAYVGESVRAPRDYYRNNVVGSLSLLGAMQDAGVNRIVFSSSCATYGVPASLPIDEATPQFPINPYGFTKLAVEHALRDFEAAYGLRRVSLRYFNAAGADPEGELGERHDPETHAIPLAILSALGRRGPFEIMGTDYPTPDGTAVRDYVHVSDLADAHVRAAKHLLSGDASLAANLATGTGVSVKEMLAAVGRATGRDVPVNSAPRRPGDPPALFASGAIAKGQLGWSPQFRDIDEIVASAARWFERN